MLVLALCALFAPKSVETYTVALQHATPVRVRVNDVVAAEGTVASVQIAHFVVAGVNRVHIEAINGAKRPATLGQVKLVTATGDYRGWQANDGQTIASLKPGVTIFSAPAVVRTPLWRMGTEIKIDPRMLVTLHAKVSELHALLAAKNVNGYIDAFRDSYDETARLYPMADVKRLKQRDAAHLKAGLDAAGLSALPSLDALTCDLEGAGLLVTCRRKGAQETFSLGDTPITVRFMKLNGALLPYAVIDND